MNKKMKKALFTTYTLAIASALNSDELNLYIDEGKKHNKLSDEEIRQKQDKIKISKGLKLFMYDNNEVWAINKKNADKKAKKKGYI